MLFVKEQFETPGAIDPGMAAHEDKIFFRQNAGFVDRKVMPAAGTRKIARLALAARTIRVRTARNREIVETVLSPVGQDMSRPCPLQQILSAKIGQVGTRRSRRVGERFAKILGPHPSFSFHEKQDLVFVGLHLDSRIVNPASSSVNALRLQ